MKYTLILLLFSCALWGQDIKKAISGCKDHIEEYYVTALKEKYVICFELKSCKDSLPILKGKAYMKFKGGKSSNKKMDNEGRFFLTFDEIKELTGLEIKSKNYMSMSFDDGSLKLYQEKLLKGKLIRVVYYTDLISNHTLY